jgi:hypothetical protein
MQTKTILAAIMLFTATISCKSGIDSKSNTKSKLVEEIYAKQNILDDVEQPIATLANTKWVFDNYDSPIDLYNFKKPYLTITSIDADKIQFSGETFINMQIGFLISKSKSNLLEKTTYKISNLSNPNKRLAFLELRYCKDFKKINSLKVP